MTASANDKKKTTALVAIATVAALAGLGVWARSQQRKKLAAQRKQLTNLRFDLSVQEIEDETARIIAKMQQVDDEVAGLAASQITFATTAQKLIDLDFEMLSRVTNVTFLGHVSAKKDIRDACNKADEAITDFSVKRGMRVDVYKTLHTFASSPDFKVCKHTHARMIGMTFVLIATDNCFNLCEIEIDACAATLREQGCARFRAQRFAIGGSEATGSPSVEAEALQACAPVPNEPDGGNHGSELLSGRAEGFERRLHW